MSLTEHGLNLIFFLDATLHLASHMCAQAQQKLLLRPSQRKRQPLHMLDHLNLCRTAYAAKVEARGLADVALSQQQRGHEAVEVLASFALA